MTLIIKEYGKYYIECDCCGCYIPGFVNFDDALDYMKECEWTYIKINDGWENLCPECAKEDF